MRKTTPDFFSFFDRDVKCIRKFFKKRFRFESREWPTFQSVMAEEAEFAAEEKRYLAEKKAAEELAAEQAESAEGDAPVAEKAEVEEPSRPTRIRLDKEVEASGFARHMQKELEDVSVVVMLRIR
jgi:RIO kinase 2